MRAATVGYFDKKLNKVQLAKLKESFDAAEVNKDGFLTKEELKTLLKGLGSDVDV